MCLNTYLCNLSHYIAKGNDRSTNENQEIMGFIERKSLPLVYLFLPNELNFSVLHGC